ncbi:MAG: hypothetical protein KJZ91_21115 [Myxococcales bacterium]|nr:hypothetical protein [Myxococcales bacterium]
MTAWRALAALGLAACVARDTVATTGGGEDLDTYCQGRGPPVLVDDTCTGAVAEALFRHALCACGDLALGAGLTTDAFDSRQGPWTPGGTGGHVASNGGLDHNGELLVGGDLTVAGARGLAAGPRADVAGNLAVAAGLGRPSSAIAVAGAAGVGGDIDVASLTVTGSLTTPAGAGERGAVTAGSRQTAAVQVPPPCRCDPAEVLDVAAVIAAHAADNHDAELGITQAELDGRTGDVTLVLPCGRYYLDRVQVTGGGSLIVRATGRTALFVAGDVTVDGALTIEVAPGAELDLFVAGHLNLPGAVTVGDPARPRDLRLYLASAGSVALSGGAAIAANLYAPATDLATSAPLELFGAVLVHRWSLSAPVALHHDRAIAVAGQACEP